MHWEGRRAAFWTRPLGVRVQKVQGVQRVVVGACGASLDKTAVVGYWTSELVG